MNRILCIGLAVTCWVSAHGSCAFADVLFESGTLGLTGVSWSDATSGTVPTVNISPHVFTGVKFHLDQPVLTTSVGGHFVSPSGGAFFGTLVSLENETDFPDSGDFSTPDTLGATLLSFPVASAEVFGDLNLSLDQGWYALVFGSGLFGANGAGGAPANNVDIGTPTYIAFQPGSGVTWIDLATFVTDLRFVVSGRSVPEPSTPILIILGLLICFSRRLSKKYDSGLYSVDFHRSAWRGIHAQLSQLVEYGPCQARISS